MDFWPPLRLELACSVHRNPNLHHALRLPQQNGRKPSFQFRWVRVRGRSEIYARACTCDWCACVRVRARVCACVRACLGWRVPRGAGVSGRGSWVSGGGPGLGAVLGGLGFGVAPSFPLVCLVPPPLVCLVPPRLVVLVPRRLVVRCLVWSVGLDFMFARCLDVAFCAGSLVAYP